MSLHLGRFTTSSWLATISVFRQSSFFFFFLLANTKTLIPSCLFLSRLKLLEAGLTMSVLLTITHHNAQKLDTPNCSLMYRWWLPCLVPDHLKFSVDHNQSWSFSNFNMQESLGKLWKYKFWFRWSECLVLLTSFWWCQQKLDPRTFWGARQHFSKSNDKTHRKNTV